MHHHLIAHYKHGHPLKPKDWEREAINQKSKAKKPKITPMELSSSSAEMEGSIRRTTSWASWRKDPGTKSDLDEIIFQTWKKLLFLGMFLLT